MSHLILPERMETQSVKRGRDVVRSIYAEVAELTDRGKMPTRVMISRAKADDLHAFLDYAYDEYDGTFPLFAGIPIVVEPGTSSMTIETEQANG